MLVHLAHRDEVLGYCRVKRRRLDTTPAEPRLSTLESLPQELLEKIFVESKNVQLLHVSQKLAWRLSSKHVRKQLITRCFRADGLLQSAEYDLEYEPISQQQRRTSQAQPQETYDEALNDLRLLLQQEWVTMKLVREAVTDWQWKIASKELYSFINDKLQPCDPASDYATASSQLRAILERSSTSMTTADLRYFEATRPRPEYSCAACCVKGPSPWILSWPSIEASTYIRIGFLEDPWRGKTALGWLRMAVLQRTGSELRPLMIKETPFIPWTASFQLLPARLLTGPWTQDRGDLSKFLVDYCTFQSLEDERFSAEQLRAAVTGVSAAMAENNLLGAAILLWSPDLLCLSMYDTMLLSEGFASDRDEPPGCVAARGGWKHLSFQQCPPRGPAFPPLALTTEQLERCIDNYHAHPGVSLTIINHLTHPLSVGPSLPSGFLDKLRIIADQPEPKNAYSALLLKSAKQLYQHFAEKMEKGTARTANRDRLQGFG